ncbi:EF-Hand 1, calcium-binding site [Phytophthora cactorum]|nr:EF-Hand 1, calcium-binding site [Phytophthora cactorum]
MTTLYQSRKARQAMAARRSRHLRRWAAKTRVSLFVHQIWTACWFHSKRSCNVAGMKQELALFEESDRNVQLEYTVVFATPLGKDVLKRELAVWRVGARTTTTQNESPTTSESDVDPVILRLRQCFRIFDLDGSGTLDLDEFQLMLSYLRGKKQKRPGRGSVIDKRSASESPKLTSAQVRNLFSELDQDGNGSITCTELKAGGQMSTSDLHSPEPRLLFWLMGRKQRLERKFVKKLVVRRAMEKAKREILHREIHRERAANVLLSVFRCDTCGRRFGLKRDLADHVAHECNSTGWVVDTFTLKRWVHEEEFRLLEGVRE